MKVIGVTGMPGSGKTVVSRVGESLGMKVVRMGDVIRDEARQRNQDPGKVALDIRKDYGEFVVAERCVDMIKTSKNQDKNVESTSSNFYLIEGIRSPYEVEIFKKEFKDFKVIAVHSKPKTRYKRLRRRRRSDDSPLVSDLQTRDQRELKFGIGEVIANSDYVVINEGSLKKLKDKLRSIIKNEMQNRS
jgi:dephospho-CoA kinase